MVLALIKEATEFVKSVTGKTIIVEEPITLLLVINNDKQQAVSKREYTFEKGTELVIDEKNKGGGFLAADNLYDIIMIFSGNPKGVNTNEEIQFRRHRTTLKVDFEKHFRVTA